MRSKGRSSRTWLRVARASRPAVLGAAGAEAIATKHRPARLWLKRHAVSLAAGIAYDFEFFAFGSSASLAGSAEVLAPGIATGLATLRMAQPALAIVILFSLTKRKSSSAFGTGYFKVWHCCLPGKVFLRFVLFNVRKVYSRYAHLYSI